MSATSRKRRKAGEAAVLEFILILPLAGLFVWMVTVVQEMMFRGVCTSHAAFTSARRCGVAQSGGSSLAQAYAERYYHSGGGMLRGAPDANAGFVGRDPKVCTVKIGDTYRLLLPTGERQGVVAVMEQKDFSEFTVSEEAAGTSSRVPSSDNEI